ncbi:MAG TPA: ATP-binding protein [Gammaproteobacteria bacterium]|nr:ATP-binding protein [Gammaproteobacteria bacterium]
MTGTSPRKQQRDLVYGFVAVIVILFSLSVFVLTYMTHISHHLAGVLETQRHKSLQVSTMRDAMRKRQVGLRDMVIEDDPFSRDAAWEGYFHAASDFIVARELLQAAGLNPQEETALEKLMDRAYEAYLKQQRVINLIRENFRGPEIITLLNEAIESQDLAMGKMDTLMQLQQSAAQQAIDDINRRYRNTLFFLPAAGFLFLLAGMTIAWIALKRDHAASQELAQYRDHLQELVTDRTRQLEHMVTEAESFSYALAHDLRQPLRGLDGYSYILLEEHGKALDQEARYMLGRIRIGTQRIGDLLDGMLTLTSLSHSIPNRIDFNLAELCRLISEQLSLEHPERLLCWEIEPEIPVHADYKLLRIAMENLLENSVKFTAGRQPAHISVRAQTTEGKTFYIVEDDGAGFDMQYADKLFQPFERLHGVNEFEGTGIGLATVARIVARHQGQIWAESCPGAGARFYFTLE